MKIFRNIFLLLFGLFLSQAIAAQTVLTGVVKDQATGAPLIGANVYIVNSSERTLDGNVVDATGQYRLKVPANATGLTVVFSFVGYETKRVAYTAQKTINATLKDESRAVDAIAVTRKRIERNSLGITQRETTSSTQKVTLESVETAPVTNIVEALQGTMSNVDILTGADPGAKAQIRIRGTSSLSASSDPLIVLDGVPFPVVIDNAFNFATANSDDFGQLLNISPNDLESIEVLKDAAATAIWGSRGANGVLVITSKKGQKGRITTSVSSKYEFKKERNTIPLLDAKQYVSLMQEEYWNTLNSRNDYGMIYTGDLEALFGTQEINFDPNWKYFDEYNQNTKWLDEVTQPGYSFDNNINITGGGEKTSYRLSLGYLDEIGTTKGTGFNRVTVKYSMTYDFSNKLRVSTDFNFTQGERESNWSGKIEKKDIGKPRAEAIRKMPNMSPYVIGEDGRRTKEYFTPESNFQGNFERDRFYNPVALVNEAFNRANENSNRVVTVLQYKIIPGLEYFGTLGLSISGTKSRGFLPQTVTGVNWQNQYFNTSFDNLSDEFSLTTENRLGFNRTFAEIHKLAVMAKVNTFDQTNSTYASSVSGNTSIHMVDPVTGGEIRSIGSGKTINRGILGVVNFAYFLTDRYYFTGGFNIEGSSAMAPNTRWGGFGNIGGGWQFGDEKFMEFAKKYLTMGKLRYSWGQTGNAPNKTGVYFGTFNALPGGYAGDPAIEPKRMQLNNLKWEVITSNTFGVDLEFLDGRVTTTFEVYDKVTTDLLNPDLELPSSTGYAEIAYFNSGKLTNKGWEWRADFAIIRKKDIGFNFGFNISQNQNTINELPSNILDSKYEFKNGTYASKAVIGDPVGSFYGYKYKGVYQNVEDTYMKDDKGNTVTTLGGKPIIMTNGNQRVYPGDAKYMDVNGDGIIDQYDIVYLGNANPTLTGGFQTNFRYKSWGLVANFTARSGQKVINKAALDMESMYGKENQSTKVLERWRNEGDQTNIPRALFGLGYNTLGSDRFVEDASFLRLQYLTLKYNVPKSFLDRYKLTQVQLYLTGYDLFVATKYRGQDPEINTKGGMFPVAIDEVTTPKPIRYAGGVIIRF